MDYLKVFIAGMVTATSMSLATSGYANGNSCNGLSTDLLAEVDLYSDEQGVMRCLTVSGNNGWGNDDQDAPGGSLENNNAENDTDGQCHENEKHGCASTD